MIQVKTPATLFKHFCTCQLPKTLLELLLSSAKLEQKKSQWLVGAILRFHGMSVGHGLFYYREKIRLMKNNIHQTNTNLVSLQRPLLLVLTSCSEHSDSHPEVFSKKVVLKNFTGKHLCQSLFRNKDSGIGVFLRILQNF